MARSILEFLSRCTRISSNKLGIQLHVSDMKDKIGDKIGATDFVSEIKGAKNTQILRNLR